MVKCAGGCGRDVSPSQLGVMSRIQGWVKTRKDGGANAVFKQEYLGEYMCAECWKLQELGGQTDLFTGF